MPTVDGATIIARSLRDQGVEHMFGVLGVPVYPIAGAAKKEGIKFYSFRNEQAASYAAGAVGYLTGRPGVCLAVSGPGMIHAIAGLANAWSNCWPMLLIGGANDSYQNGLGAFQEAPQVEAARPFVKYAARPDSMARMPFFIEQAIRHSMAGRPGATYIDLPGDFISGEIDEESVRYSQKYEEPPRPFADPTAVEQALDLLRSAENPLVVVGKGAAYARAEDEVKEFIETTQLPFLPSPMGKGLLPDDHPLSVAAARSYALQNADVIFLVGARLNWIMHFGAPPRFRADVRTIQLDISAEEIGNGVPAEVGLVGDARSVLSQLNESLRNKPWQYPAETTWRVGIAKKAQDNQAGTEPLLNDDAVPMGYYRALREMRDRLPKDVILVSEGANTMDIARAVLPSFFPRHRLDAGSFGTMGVGTGFAIASSVVHPDKKVVALLGDSAFGFSGMEVEVACRFNLPIVFVVFNNNMGGGQRYVVNAHYEQIIEAFGGKGYYVNTPEEFGTALTDAIGDPTPSLINVMIDPKAQRRPQQFEWLTR
ncbi:MAG: oxalyl-CoA decarboxylase [Dehalococcoidia bacterium]|nr:oxalyl-CoA decarboxylase [Dehalococcoidia bacterium]